MMQCCLVFLSFLLSLEVVQFIVQGDIQYRYFNCGFGVEQHSREFGVGY